MGKVLILWFDRIYDIAAGVCSEQWNSAVCNFHVKNNIFQIYFWLVQLPEQGIEQGIVRKFWWKNCKVCDQSIYAQGLPEQGIVKGIYEQALPEQGISQGMIKMYRFMTAWKRHKVQSCGFMYTLIVCCVQLFCAQTRVGLLLRWGAMSDQDLDDWNERMEEAWQDAQMLDAWEAAEQDFHNPHHDHWHIKIISS